MNKLVTLIVASIAGAVVFGGSAHADVCGQLSNFPVGDRFSQVSWNGTELSSIIVYKLPVGSNSITIATNPVTSGPNVIYSGSVAAGQTINLPSIPAFYLRIGGTGGEAVYRLCRDGVP